MYQKNLTHILERKFNELPKLFEISERRLDLDETRALTLRLNPRKGGILRYADVRPAWFCFTCYIESSLLLLYMPSLPQVPQSQMTYFE